MLLAFAIRSIPALVGAELTVSPPHLFARVSNLESFLTPLATQISLRSGELARELKPQSANQVRWCTRHQECRSVRVPFDVGRREPFQSGVDELAHVMKSGEEHRTMLPTQSIGLLFR